MGWSHYKPIAVSAANVDANLTDCPVLAKVSADGDLSKAQADGDDIKFTLDNGTTELKYERLTWSGGGGSAATAIFWVKVPSINLSTGAAIRMYYGNPAASDGQDVAGTFSASGLVAALHLNEASGPFADATGHGHSGADSSTIQVAGLIDNGRGTNAASDRITITDHADLDSMDDLVTECWFNLTGYAYHANAPFVAKEDPFDAYGMDCQQVAGNRTRFLVNNSADNGGAASTGVWYHQLGFYERDTISGHGQYRDGALTGTPDNAPDVAVGNFAGHLILLGRGSAADRAFDGMIEEFRLWNTANPCGNRAAYAKFVHANVTSGDNELTFGAEVAVGNPWNYYAQQAAVTG